MASYPKPGRRILVVAALTFPLIAIMVIGLVPTAANADPGAEAQLRELVNEERAGANLPQLSADGGLTSGAETHASDMAAAGGLSHQAMSAIQCPGPRAENVGWGPSVEAVHRMFMEDPSHRVHVLGRFDQVGIGVVAVGGIVFVTEVFCLAEAGPAPLPVPLPIPVIPVVKEKPAPAPMPAPGPGAAPVVSATPVPVVSSGMGSPCHLI